MSNWTGDKAQPKNNQIRITEKGLAMLKEADTSDLIFPNEIHLLSGIRDGKAWLISHFEQFNT